MPSDHAEDSMEGAVGEQRRRMPRDREGWNIKVEIAGHEGYIIVGTYEDGSLGEVFLHGFGKDGSTLDGWTNAFAIMFSIALQYGAEFPMLARKFAHMKFEPYGTTNDPQVPWCASAVDYIFRKLARHFGDQQLNLELDNIAKEMRG